MDYTIEEFDELANSFKQKSGDYVWEWILRVLDNAGKNIKLDQPDFIDRVISFWVEILALIWKFPQFKKVKSLSELLDEEFVKRWTTRKELEMHGISQLGVDKYR